MMIKMFCKGLPSYLSKQLYEEYSQQKSQLDYQLKINKDHYTNIIENVESTYFMIALSIFHKRIISQLKAANNFNLNLYTLADVCLIKIGNYNFTSDEFENVKTIINEYTAILKKFNIPEWLFDYSNIQHFLRNIYYHQKQLKEGNNFNGEDQSENPI